MLGDRFFFAAIPKLCENENGGCEHFCRVNQGNTECSCTDGYILASDLMSCIPNGEKDSRVYMFQTVQTLWMNRSVDNILSKNGGGGGNEF